MKTQSLSTLSPQLLRPRRSRRPHFVVASMALCGLTMSAAGLASMHGARWWYDVMMFLTIVSGGAVAAATLGYAVYQTCRFHFAAWRYRRTLRETRSELNKHDLS